MRPAGRVRRPGGGRKRAMAKGPSLAADLESLVGPVTRGDPESPLRWTCKSVRRLGHQASYPVVAELLHELGYSLQANRKTRESDSHPDRNAQFEYLNRKVQQYWASVGVDHDTSPFAVESIRRWWYSMGKLTYPKARRLLITADSGGGNGSRVRLWKLELQRLADETKLRIAVCHFPPGTSKWNKIEHRLFSFSSQNWRSKPLTSLKVIVSLIAATSTHKGLKVRSGPGTRSCPAGAKVSEAEMSQVLLRRDKFHGDWNYEIAPHP